VLTSQEYYASVFTRAAQVTASSSHETLHIPERIHRLDIFNWYQ